MTLDSKTFGKHVKSLRKARGITQEELAERTTLSADTIRRLEHGTISPSLTSLQKLCAGFGLELSTFFEAAQLCTRDEQRELKDLLATRTPRELELGTRVLRALFDELDAIAAERNADDDEDDDEDD